MFWDTHMHCYFSGDSDASPRSMVEGALKKNLPGICFTDHQDLDYRKNPGFFDLDFKNYQKETNAKNLAEAKENLAAPAENGNTNSDPEIDALVVERNEAKKAKNWARADEIRNELLEKGIALEDTREGVKWKMA